MNIKHLLILSAFISSPAFSDGQSISSTAGRILGEMTGDFATEFTKQATKDFKSAFPMPEPVVYQWQTIPPKSQDECKKESNNVLNEVYMRCRHGFQEYVAIHQNGQRTVINTRKIQ